MQTFLPYKDIQESLKSLDNARLKNQRTEALDLITSILLFMTLPFQGITDTGVLLPLFDRICTRGYDKHYNPEKIVNYFFDKYQRDVSEEERYDLLFRFIQYIERQVVLFDAIEDAGFSYVNNDMLEEDEQAAAWVKRNRNCDLFMKRVDPQVGGDTYSIHEEARKADTSSHMFSVHYQGCLYMPNGSVWDGNKLLRVRTLAAIKKRKAKKRRKKERKEQRRKDREEKMRGV